MIVNGQDTRTGDIDDGRPERIRVRCEHFNIAIFRWECPECDVHGLRDETDSEYWARVEAMRPSCAEDLM